MAIIQGNAKSSSAAGGFYPKVINGSLRFNDDDSAYLSWTPASAGDSRTWTLSFWMKPSNASTGQVIFGAGPNSSNLTRIDYRADKRFQIFNSANGVANGSLVFDPYKFRDPSAWYHFVFVVNTPASETDRYQFYANGERLTGISSTAGENTYPSSSATTQVNTTVAHEIGRRIVSNSEYFDGYLANVHFLNGIAATADDFGELKNGVWVAKDYTGLFDSAAETALGHANGFYLTFEDDTQVEAFNTVLYRGSANAQSITGMGFQPDLVWVKSRSNASSNALFDSVRGTTKRLRSDTTDLEDTNTGVTSFDSDGFSIGTSTSTNGDGRTFVAWGWKAGGAPTVDNSAGAGNVPTAGSVKIDGVNSTSALAGSIPATRLSASDTYGFSIVGYTGDGNISRTVAHGLTLSSAPTNYMVIIKSRTISANWQVWHSGNSGVRLKLDTVDGDFGNYPITFGADTITLPALNSASWDSLGKDYIAYCWSETAGYSKFGSYTGNGSTTGPIIYTTDDGTAGGANGFKPSMILIKRTDTAGNWVMSDTTRDVDGTLDRYLLANSSDAEGDTTGNSAGNAITITDTGFQLANTNADRNASGGTYIYAAFADTREAAFWLDQSGNDNDWQPVNLDHNDTLLDSPTNNFATMNPLAKGPNNTLSDGNLQVLHGGTGGWQQCQSTFAFPNSGKWYCEFTIVYQGDATDRVGINVSKVGYGPINTSTNLSGGNNANIWTYFAHTGSFYHNGVSSGSASTFGTGDVIQVSFDSDTGSLYFGKNGVWQNSGNPTAGTGYAYTGLSDVAVGTEGYSNAKVLANFGQQPFKYDPPA